MDTQQIDAVASKLFAAIEKGDIDLVRDEVYHEDVEVWINASGRAQPRDDSLKLLRNFTGRVSELRYEVLARDFLADGFVQRHVLHCKTAAGEELSVPVCLVVHLKDGLIHRLYEYMDGAAIAPAFAS